MCQNTQAAPWTRDSHLEDGSVCVVDEAITTAFGFVLAGVGEGSRRQWVKIFLGSAMARAQIDKTSSGVLMISWMHQRVLRLAVLGLSVKTAVIDQND